MQVLDDPLKDFEMNRYMKGLRIDPFIITQEIEEFLRSKFAESCKQGFILGLSGGLDSAVAAYLQIPADIRNKAADPDLIPSVDNKGELLGSFEITDQILWGFEHGIRTEDLS